MNQQIIRIGIFSFAHLHATSYADSLQKLPHVTFVGIYDDEPERGRQYAEAYGVPYFDSAEALLGQSLDGAIICSENVKHHAMVKQCAGWVKHILCEKPISTNMADGQEMIDICAKTGTRLQIAFPVRFAPTIQEIKETLDTGKLGRVYSAKTTNHGFVPGMWFVEKELSGGGAVLDHTVHVIDLLRWFWGAEVTEVYAEIGYDLLHPGLGIDDVGMLSFALDNGIYGTLDTSWSRPASYPTWGDVKLEIVGEKGAIYTDSLNQHIAVSSDRTGKTSWVGWGSNMDLGLIKDFVGMIREDREPSITGEDGLRALEVALAAYRSAESGKPVALPLT